MKRRNYGRRTRETGRQSCCWGREGLWIRFRIISIAVKASSCRTIYDSGLAVGKTYYYKARSLAYFNGKAAVKDGKAAGTRQDSRKILQLIHKKKILQIIHKNRTKMLISINIIHDIC